MNRRRTGLGLVTTLAALSLAACSSGTSTTGTEPTTGAPPPSTAATSAAANDLAAQVPDAIKSDGTLKIGTDASYPPNEYVDTDGKTIVGWDVDLGTAIAEKLGLKAEFENAKFDTHHPGRLVEQVRARRLVVHRQPRARAGRRLRRLLLRRHRVGGRKGNPKNVDPDNACGLKVGVQQGTVQVDDIDAKSKACTDAGKPAIEQVIRTQQTEVNADLVSGKTDAMAADSPIVGYAVKQTGDKIEIVGKVYDTAPYGFAVEEGLGDDRRWSSRPCRQLMDDGTYKSIMDKWGVADGAVTEVKVNGAQG